MFQITAFIVLILAVGGGALAREGALVLEGFREGERVQVRRGRQDEDPTSKFRGGDLALSCDRCVIFCDLCVHFLVLLSPLWRRQFWMYSAAF
jgi:hypothetical protein